MTRCCTTRAWASCAPGDHPDGDSSSPDVGLIVGVAVAVPLAVAVVLTVTVVGLVLAWRRRKLWAAGAADFSCECGFGDSRR